MGLIDSIRKVFSEDENQVTAADILTKVREKYPHLAGFDDARLSSALARKYPDKFGYLKTYAPDAPVPPALVPKSLRTEAFYKAHPEEGTKEALKVIDQVKAKYPKYKNVDAQTMASALETKYPDVFPGLMAKLSPGNLKDPGDPEAGVAGMFASLPNLGPGQIAKPVTPPKIDQIPGLPKPAVQQPPQPKARPMVISLDSTKVSLPKGTPVQSFKNGDEAYLAAEKAGRPIIVEYPNRNGQVIRRILGTTNVETQVPDVKSSIVDAIAKKAVEIGGALGKPTPEIVGRAVVETLKTPPDVLNLTQEQQVRTAKNLASGGLSTVAGMIGAVPAMAQFIGADGKVPDGLEKAVGKLTEMAAKVAPDDPTFGDKMVQGAASMAVFWVPGLGAAGAVSKMAELGAMASKIAKVTQIALPTVLEAATEQGGIYNDLVAKGLDKKEAAKRAFDGFWKNLVLLGVTNTISVGPESEKLLVNALRTAPSEGFQESVQELISSTSKGEKVDWKNVIESGGIGAILGFAGGGAFGSHGGGESEAGPGGRPDNTPSPQPTMTPEMRSYLDKVAEINRKANEVPSPDFLKEDVFRAPTQKEANAAEEARFAAAPDSVQRMAHSIRNEAVSQYNLDRNVFSQWKDLIGPGLQPPKIIAGQRDVMGEYNTLEVWMKKKDGRPIDVVAQDAVEMGLIKSPEDIFDALRSLKAPSNPSRNAVDYLDEALRIHNYESSIEPQGPVDTGFDFQVEQPDFSAEKPTINKEHYAANLAKARIAGMPLREAVAFARESSLSQGQKSAVEAFNRIITANKLTDSTFVQFVDSIKVDEEAFKKGYGAEFQADKYAIRGATFPIKNHPVVKSLVQFAIGAHAGTGYHEAFHTISSNVLTEQEYAVLKKKFGTEENMAEAFAKYEKMKTGREKQTAIKTIFDKISAFLARLRSYFNGKGWRTAEDVFKGISEGRTARAGSGGQGETQYQAGDLFPETKDNVAKSFDRLVADGEQKGLTHADAVRMAKAKLAESAATQTATDNAGPMFKQRGFSADGGVKGFGATERGQGELYQAESKNQTETPAFKKWFGDSKVVDADGKPLVVYHGTNSNFDVFENKGGTVSTFISNEKVERSGFFFTPNEKLSMEFGGKTIPAFLSIKKLADFQYPTQELFNDLEKNGFNTRFFEVRQPNEYWEAFDGSVGKDFVSALTKAGYDGAKIVESDTDGRLHETFVAFSPTQIKSATGNSGAFDPQNPSILYQAEKTGLIDESVYDQNRKMQRSGGLSRGISAVATSAKDQAESLLTPISSVLADINPMLRIAFRRQAYREGLTRNEDTKAVLPFLQKARAMRPDDMADLDLALKNGDAPKISSLVSAYGLDAEYKAARKTLNAIHARAKEVGYDVGYLEDYWPRVVKDQAGFLEAIKADKKWPDIDKLISMKQDELRRPLSEDEKVALINSYLRGYQNGAIALARTPNMKTREVEVIGPGLNQHFRQFDDAVVRYISSMNHAIEARRFFGRGGKDLFVDELDQSIGHYVMDMKTNGLLKDARDEKRLRTILNAYFKQESMHGALAAYKDATVAMTIGNSIAALTQLQDFGTSVYRAPGHVVQALGRALIGGSKITLEDLGLDQIAEELRDDRKSAVFVSKVLRAAGLAKLDKLTAETFINSVISKYQSQARAKTPGSEFMDRIRNLVGPDTGKAIEDLKSGEVTDLVKFIAFSEILGVQPKAMTELPKAYLSGGNSRIFYALKTFQIRQLDLFRQEIFKKLAEPGLKNKVIGTRRLIAITTSLLLAGIGTDELKDWFLGRKTTMSDRVTDNLLKMAGLSKWTIYKARQEGIGSAVMKTVLPPAPLVDQLWKDIRTAGDGKGLESVQSIPWFGKPYFWWFGKGASKRPISDDAMYLKTNASRLGLSRIRAYQTLNRSIETYQAMPRGPKRDAAKARALDIAKTLAGRVRAREDQLAEMEKQRRKRAEARALSRQTVEQ